MYNGIQSHGGIDHGMIYCLYFIILVLFGNCILDHDNNNIVITVLVLALIIILTLRLLLTFVLIVIVMWFKSNVWTYVLLNSLVLWIIIIIIIIIKLDSSISRVTNKYYNNLKGSINIKHNTNKNNSNNIYNNNNNNNNNNDRFYDRARLKCSVFGNNWRDLRHNMVDLNIMETRCWY